MAIKRGGNLLLAAALILAVGFTGSVIGGTNGKDSGPEQKVAFISLSKVLNAHKGLIMAEDEIKKLLQNGEAEVGRAQKEMEDLKSEIMVYSKDSKEFQEGTSEIERKELAVKQKKRELLTERDFLSGKALREAYRDVERAVAAYSREKGITAVFSGSLDIEKVNSPRPEDLFNWISMVDVVWHDDRLDISDAIITIVNES